MPFYEYQCTICNAHTEALQKVSDPPLRKCPTCGRSKLKKLISAPNFRLKGGGWYETDFKTDQDKKRNLALDKEPEPKASEDAKAKVPETKAAEGKPAEAKPAADKPAEKEKSAASKESGSESGTRSSSARKTSAKSKPRPKPVKRRARR